MAGALFVRQTQFMNRHELLRRLMGESDPVRRRAWLEPMAHGAEVTSLIERLKAEVERRGDGAYQAGERALEAAACALGLTACGRFAEALPFYEEASRGLESLGCKEGAARLGMRQIQALVTTGEMAQAWALAQQTRVLFMELGLLREAALVDIHVGAIHYRLGRVREAEAVLGSALEQLERLGDRVGQGKAHGNLALVYEAQDRYREAMNHCQQALRIFRAHHQLEDFIGCSVNLALLYRKEGRLNQALDLLSRVRGIHGTPNAARAQLAEARVYLDLNLWAEAILFSQELVEFFAERGMRMELAEALVTLGSAQAKQGRLEEAHQTLERARSGWLALNNAIQAARVEVLLASLYLQSGHNAQAVGLVEQALEGLGGAPSAKALGLSVMAEALLRQGNHSKARRRLEEAASLALGLGMPDLIVRIEHLRGRAAVLENRVQAAELHFKRAIERLEKVRIHLGVDEFKLAYLGDKLEVYSDLIDLLLDQQRLHEAFECVERVKSRALVDLLAQRGEGEPPQGRTDFGVERLRQELAGVRRELNQHLVALEAQGQGTRGHHREKMVALEQRIMRLTCEIKRRQLGASTAKERPNLRLLELQKILQPGAVLLEYHHTRRGLMAFVVEGPRAEVVCNLGSLEQVQRHVEQLEFFLSRVAQGGILLEVYGEETLKRLVDEQLQALYHLLIEPLPLRFFGQPLVVVPHGLLHAVPFAALFDGERYLLDRAEVSFTPSAAVYALCRKRQRLEAGSLVAFGVSLEHIPQTIEEVEQISRIVQNAHTFVGERATLENFFTAAPQAGVLHIATHGAFRPDNPMFSGLRLADGWLAARDLYSLRLKAELVVLSACETGLAKQVGGDELVGLARGFLCAGATSLITSLWPVRDDATAQFMVTLYTHLRAGKPIATALREAQLATRTAFPNPYFWSAFAVTGDPHRTLRL